MRLRGAHVDADASIGENVELAAEVSIGAQVCVGDGVKFGVAAVVLGPTRIGEGCVIGPAAVLAPPEGSETLLVLDSGVHIGAGATIAEGIRIGTGAQIDPGAVVGDSVPPYAIVSGNPAQITGYRLSEGSLSRDAMSSEAPRDTGSIKSVVRGVTLHRMPKIIDLRGNLSVGEFERHVPFVAKRYFLVFGVPNAEIRGEHAHRTCDQFLVCVAGGCSVVVDDGSGREEFRLDDPSLGLFIPAMTWGIQYKYTSDAVLLVFASEFYDRDDYIRDYVEFLSLVESGSERSVD